MLSPRFRRRRLPNPASSRDDSSQRLADRIVTKAQGDHPHGIARSRPDYSQHLADRLVSTVHDMMYTLHDISCAILG